jgi:hypothetical protein
MRIDGDGNVGIGTSSPATLTAGITALSISDQGGKTTGDKIGELNFVTNDGSFTGTYADGIGAAINAVATSATGAAYGLSFTTATITGSNRAERVRITETGNVGIGTSSPGARLDVGAGVTSEAIQVNAGSGWSDLILKSSASNGGSVVWNDGADAGEIFYYHADNSMSFKTNATERARIDSSGNLLVGTTSFSFNPTQGATVAGGSVGAVGIGHASGTAEGNGYLNFTYNGTNIGSVTQSGTTSVLYNTSSDARLKDNIADAEDAANLIDAIQVRKFDWKADGSHQRYGMVAQELVEVAPEAVQVPQDEDEMMGVDYSKLVPMLVKEIQSLRARVAQLEG